MKPIDVERHTYAVRASGYTRVGGAVTGAWLEDLGRLGDASLARATEVLRAKGSLSHLNLGPDYMASRCLYCWGPAAVRLIEHQDVRDLSERLLDCPRLWDLSVLSAEPASSPARSPAGNWHRDTSPVDTATTRPKFLWFFLCLDATTAENGATWVVPGSHHKAGGDLPADARTGEHPFPTAMQLCGEAGDLLIVDPTALHAAGINRTRRPRRLINVAMCSAGTPPLFNHWAVAGTAIQATASPYLRAVLDVPDQDTGKRRDCAWEALPVGWQTA